MRSEARTSGSGHAASTPSPRTQSPRRGSSYSTTLRLSEDLPSKYSAWIPLKRSQPEIEAEQLARLVAHRADLLLRGGEEPAQATVRLQRDPLQLVARGADLRPGQEQAERKQHAERIDEIQAEQPARGPAAVKADVSQHGVAPGKARKQDFGVSAQQQVQRQQADAQRDDAAGEEACERQGKLEGGKVVVARGRRETEPRGAVAAVVDEHAAFRAEIEGVGHAKRGRHQQAAKEQHAEDVRLRALEAEAHVAVGRVARVELQRALDDPGHRRRDADDGGDRGQEMDLLQQRVSGEYHEHDDPALEDGHRVAEILERRVVQQRVAVEVALAAHLGPRRIDAERDDAQADVDDPDAEIFARAAREPERYGGRRLRNGAFSPLHDGPP